MNKEQQIRDRAYALWEAEGRPQGKDRQHWQTAEQEVASTSGQQADAPAMPRRKPAAKSPGSKSRSPSLGE